MNCKGHFTATTVWEKSSNLLSHNVAITMGLVKRIAEIKETKQLSDASPADIG